MTQSAQLSDYSLGVDDAERARLLAQCALHRGEATELLDRIGLPAGARALDLGCGPLGVLDLVVADAADTGLPGAAFDLVHERLVLVNVPRPEDVLAEMVRLTRPGGCVA